MFDFTLMNLSKNITPAVKLHTLTQWTDAEVSVPINDARTGKVSFSVYDRAADVILAHRNMGTSMQVRYRDQPVLWGPVKRTVDFEKGVVTCEIYDPSIRLQHHYLGIGDAALNATSGDEGSINADYRGVRLLRDAAQNTIAQDQRGVPNLGIIDGAAGTTNPLVMGVERGQEVWSLMKQIAEGQTGPDFELEPVFDQGDAYARLNCFDEQGADVSQVVRFSYPGNAANVEWAPGLATTHAHVLDSERKYRETTAAVDSSAETGVYVRWEATDSKVVGADTAYLKALADALIGAYGEPPNFITVTLRQDAGQRRFYLSDFKVGDRVLIAAKRGFAYIEQKMRVTQVDLEQSGPRRPTTTKLTVVPTIVGATSGESA